MVRMEIKKNSKTGNYNVNLFFKEKPQSKCKSHYTNILTKDPNKLAQVFLDLHFEGFPITKALKVMRERLKKKDWLGL